jgi:DNA-binding Xre family transcriptional regulator
MPTGEILTRRRSLLSSGWQFIFSVFHSTVRQANGRNPDQTKIPPVVGMTIHLLCISLDCQACQREKSWPDEDPSCRRDDNSSSLYFTRLSGRPTGEILTRQRSLLSSGWQFIFSVFHSTVRHANGRNPDQTKIPPVVGMTIHLLCISLDCQACQREKSWPIPVVFG